ncbi:hypothetical protein [Acinetobacter sp. YH12153]|uniref:hypothetical protein n=1 Tax=Acinetobacter sp. YH12153 TaxID=2601133 RepID=UPI0015D46880|nr:hypothetical protein [Acinetobacter sp. YH12153]
MKKEKVIYYSKVFCLFSIFLLIFAYIYSFVIQIIMPVSETIQASTSENLLLCLAYIIGLMTISVLAQKLALRFVKKPDSV